MTLRLSIDGTRLRDHLGREVLLRGINAGGRSKLPPYAPFPFEAVPFEKGAYEEAASGYLDQLASFGLDVVRLPFSWEALEPARGTYDDAFLERYLALVRGCGARGMRVIVDFHQDVFARPYAGDGFPLWACPSPTPPPAGPEHHWFLGYVQNDDVKRAFDRFWRNEDGLMDAFEAMWRHIASRAWALDAVIGFEVINEPGWGSAALPEWGPNVLAPFYAKMAGVIREVAPGAPIFFDATGADALTATTTLTRPEADGLVFAPHFYVPEVIMAGTWNGKLAPVKALKQWAELGERWNLPVLVGEFGLTPKADSAASYVRANYEQLDAHRMHGTLWECSTTEDDWNDEDMSVLGPGGEERSTVEALVRPYPAATGGDLLAFSFDAAARTGTWRWSAKAALEGKLVVPRRCFPNGVKVSAPEGVTHRHDVDEERLFVSAPADGEVQIEFGALS